MNLPGKEARLPVRLILFGVSAVLAVWIGFFVYNVDASRILVRRYGYYTIALTFVWAAFAFARVRAPWRDEIKGVTRREWLQAGLAIMACSLVAILTAPIVYKVLYDEMVLQATARQMHFFREVSTIVRGYTIDGVFAPFDTYLDKRPFFFPFVVSLLHDFTGYREANAFVLNGCLMPVVLAQVYLLARRLSAHAGALAGVVVLGTMSLLAHNATGSGMEMLNLAMLLLALHLAAIYLDAPDPHRLSALVLSAVLLAQTRYESSLYVAPVALVVLEGWRRAGRIILPAAALLCPLLLIPYALHNTYLSSTPLLWELRNDAVTRFDLKYLGTNLDHAVKFFFSFSSMITNSAWLAGTGILALGAAGTKLWQHRARWKDTPPVVLAVGYFGAAIVANLVLLMFYYWGQLDDPIVGRLSLPFSALLAIVIAYAVQTFDRPRLRLAWVAAGGAVLGYLGLGLAANARQSDLNTVEHELTWERRFIEALPPGDRLIITNKSSLPWMLRDTPAILVSHARRRADAVRTQLETGTFREIIVLQCFRPVSVDGGFQLLPSDRLPDSFVLKTLTERRIGAHIARISRLVEIKPAPANAEPAQ